MATEIEHRALKDTINQCRLVVCEASSVQVCLAAGGEFDSRCTPFGEMSIISLVTPGELARLRSSLVNARIVHRVYRMGVRAA